MRSINKKKTILIAILVALAAYGAYIAISGVHRHADLPEAAALYTCPMHPQIVQEKPGSCPICGMNLVLKKKEALGAKGEEPAAAGSGLPAELAPVTMGQAARDRLGITFTPVVKRSLRKEIRIPAHIIPDEARLYRITVKVSGWVEKLFVNQTGQSVRKGSPLLSLYSPELLSAQEEYLSAIRAIKQGSEISNENLRQNLEAMRGAARERLRLLDLTDAQIDRLETTGRFERTTVIYAPVSGFVLEKMVVAGQKLMMNDTLMTVGDLSRVWGEADVYENDIPYVRKGMPVKLLLSYWPGREFRGHISFISPMMNEETRTLKVRMDIVNAAFDLKTGMYADAVITSDAGKKLAVPEGAVMRTGVKNYVFVAGSGDEIVPREVELGARSADGWFEVRGLREGERVVLSANFLVDSESSLRATFQSIERERVQERAGGVR